MSAAKHEREQGLMALFTATPQISEIEQARHYIATHRAARDEQERGSRAWHVEQIKLDWWVAQLLRAIGEAA